MKNNTLTPEQVKFWAGWIPVKKTLMIFLLVNSLLMASCMFINANNFIVITLIIILIIILVITVFFVWRSGSNNPKYQIQFLNEIRDSQKKSIKMYLGNSKYKVRLSWHKNRLALAEEMLRNYGRHGTLMVS